MKTRIGGVRLKQNACPISDNSGSSTVTDDMDLVTSEGIRIPTNTSVMAATSPLLKVLMRYHDQYEGKIQLLLPDYSSETIENFREFLHLGDVCISGKQVEDMICLLTDLRIDQDLFSINQIDEKSFDDYLSRYSSLEIAAGAEVHEGQEEGGADRVPKADGAQDPRQDPDTQVEEEFQSCGGNEKRSTVGCPFVGCGLKFQNQRIFWKHVVYMHMKEQLMVKIQKQDQTDGVTRCPYEDCSFETRSADERVMLNHYAIIHRIIHKMFANMFPDHDYTHK